MKIRKLITCYILTITEIRQKAHKYQRYETPVLPSHLYRTLHCTAPFSLPVFFNDIHKVSICLFSDVFEPQREQSWLIQAHSAPAPFLLQHFIQRGLAVAELLLLGRTQKSILSLWTVSSWSLNNREQNTPRECQWLGTDRRHCKEQKLKEALPSTPWALPRPRQRLNSPCLESIHISCGCISHISRVPI